MPKINSGAGGSGGTHVTIVVWTAYMPDIRFVRINKPRHTVDFRPFWAIIRVTGVFS